MCSKKIKKYQTYVKVKKKVFLKKVKFYYNYFQIFIFK